MNVKSLYILPTNYCPLNCAHCAVRDKNTPRYDLNMDIAEKLIHDAPSQQFSVSIISGGGEPFAIDKSVLTRILTASTRENLYTKMTTNAYWASSYHEAYKRLEPLTKSGLKHLVVSISEGHQEYVKYDQILNAVRAANNLNIRCNLYLTTLNRKTDPLKNIVDYFIRHKQPLPYIFSEYYYIPFGNAEENFDLSDFKLTDISNIRGGCPSVGNNICVHPNGVVTPCAMVFSLYVPALHIGNVYHDSLAIIKEKVDNSRLAQWLAVHGVVALKEIVEENTDIRFANQYVNICHLCCDLLRNHKVLQFLRDIGLTNEQ